MDKKYDNIVDKILNIIKEDKNQPEFLFRNDLNKMLSKEIDYLIQDAYDDGYTACKSGWSRDFID